MSVLVWSTLTTSRIYEEVNTMQNKRIRVSGSFVSYLFAIEADRVGINENNEIAFDVDDIFTFAKILKISEKEMVIELPSNKSEVCNLHSWENIQTSFGTVVWVPNLASLDQANDINVVQYALAMHAKYLLLDAYQRIVDTTNMARELWRIPNFETDQNKVFNVLISLSRFQDKIQAEIDSRYAY